MSTYVSARFYFKDRPPSPREAFRHMANAVALWSPASDDEWKDLEIVGQRGDDPHLEMPGPLSTTTVQEATSGVNEAITTISARVPFRCWRFYDGKIERGWNGAWVTCYETSHVHGQPFLESADFTSWHTGPYNILLHAEHNSYAQDVNRHVEENLEELTVILFDMIDRLQPDSMKVFTDAGLYLPFNAHMAYYKDESMVVDDLQFLSYIWHNAVPGYDVPLKAFDPERNPTAFQDYPTVFHLWRDEAARVQLWHELKAVISHVDLVTTEVVRDVVRSGLFDTYTMSSGTTILDYPAFLNAFLDRFYLDILAHAAIGHHMRGDDQRPASS